MVGRLRAEKVVLLKLLRCRRGLDSFSASNLIFCKVLRLQSPEVACRLQSKREFLCVKKGVIGAAEKEESLMRLKEPQSELLRGQPQMSSGLERFQSAPSLFLGEICGEFRPETDTMFPRFSAPNFPENLSSGSGQLRPPALSEILNPHHKLVFPSAPLTMYHRSQRQIENFRNSPNFTRLESSPAVASFPHLNADNGNDLFLPISARNNKGKIFMLHLSVGYAVISSNSFRDKDLPPITCPLRQNSLMPQISDIGSEESGHGKVSETQVLNIGFT